MSSANAQTFGETMRRNRKMNLPLFIFSFAATFLVALVGRLTNKKYIQSSFAATPLPRHCVQAIGRCVSFTTGYKQDRIIPLAIRNVLVPAAKAVKETLRRRNTYQCNQK